MRGLRRTAGAFAAALGAIALGAALALLSGFLYAVVRGEPTGAMVAWILGLFVLAGVLFGAFGATLPDEQAEAESAAAPTDGADDGDWYDPLVFGLVLVGLVAGGPFGIAGYEALKPTTVTAVAPATPSTTPTRSPSASPATSPSAAFLSPDPLLLPAPTLFALH